MSHVIDASSLLTLVKKEADKAFDALKKCITVPLIYYEVGNALRTSAVNLKHIEPEEAESALENLHKALRLVKITPQDSVQDCIQILQNSINYNLSYYDSAYLTAAIKHKVALVTEDKRLQKAARSVKIQTGNVETL